MRPYYFWLYSKDELEPKAVQTTERALAEYDKKSQDEAVVSTIMLTLALSMAISAKRSAEILSRQELGISRNS